MGMEDGMSKCLEAGLSPTCLRVVSRLMEKRVGDGTRKVEQ